MDIFSKRLPGRDAIVSVFGVTVFIVHSWAARQFIYLVPSYLYYKPVTDMLAIFFYMMAFALLESFLVTGVLVFLSMITPEKWLRAGFSYKGFLALVIASIESIYVQPLLNDLFPAWRVIYAGIFVPLVVFILLALLFHRVLFLQRVLLVVIDRITIMTYIYIPLGLLGLIIVIVRNI